MKNNTVVIACDKNYYWGAFLLIASMRKNGMDEQVLVYQSDFSKPMKECMGRFGDVEFVDAPPDERSMTCLKAVAMLHAKTDYITWADCDGFFSGNCSDKLVYADPDVMHARIRSEKEFAISPQARPIGKEKTCQIRDDVLAVWRKDVGENETPALPRTISACYFSLHKKHRDFLERWRDFMETYLPKNNVGVVNQKLGPYFQLDESTLNALLCFMKNAPRVSETFLLDKEPAALYYHIVRTPKPWQNWSGYSLRFHKQIMDLMRYARESGVLGDYPVPWTLNESYAFFHRALTFRCYWIRLKRKIARSFK